MTSTTPYRSNLSLDFMSACSYTARRTGGNWRRSITLFLLPDATVLFLAWQIAETSLKFCLEYAIQSTLTLANSATRLV